MLIRVIRTCIAATLFIFCLWYIFETYEWNNVFNVIAHVKLHFLFLGAGFAIITFWVLRTLRWYILLRSIGIPICLRCLYLPTAISLSIALFTPFMSGEFLKIEFLKRQENINRLSGYSTVIVEKFMDAIVLLFMAIMGIPLFVTSEIPTYFVFILFVVPIGFVILVRVFISHIHFSGVIGEFFDTIRIIFFSKKDFYVLFALTIAAWAMVILGWMVCLLSISINVNYFQTTGILGLITLANILSFIPGGIGVSETSSAELLIYMGYTVHRSQAGALMFRLYEVYMLFLGGCHLLMWRFFLKTESIKNIWT